MFDSVLSQERMELTLVGDRLVFKCLLADKNMGKLNQLLGVANNLADSFVSPTNHHFLYYLESLPVEKQSYLK